MPIYYRRESLVSTGDAALRLVALPTLVQDERCQFLPIGMALQKMDVG